MHPIETNKFHFNTPGFKIIFGSENTELLIDGNQVALTMGDFAFDQLNLALSGPAVPNITYYFDDFNIEAYPINCTIPGMISHWKFDLILNQFDEWKGEILLRSSHGD